MFIQIVQQPRDRNKINAGSCHSKGFYHCNVADVSARYSNIQYYSLPLGGNGLEVVFMVLGSGRQKCYGVEIRQ
jgi:hypothetical protein